MKRIDQMELALAEAPRRLVGRRGGRMTRARWWFQQMHRAVEEPAGWRPGFHLPLDGRTVRQG